MAKINCWEFKKCGREAGGLRVNEMGICPASMFVEADGFLGGKNGGRGCAYIEGTFCSDAVQGTHAHKEKHCGQCDFYQVLRQEDGQHLSLLSFLEYTGLEE